MVAYPATCPTAAISTLQARTMTSATRRGQDREGYGGLSVVERARARTRAATVTPTAPR
ncbi:hypothetical protein [Streptomyces sp. NPDC001020]